MTKKQAIAIITKCAKQYQQYLEGNQVVLSIVTKTISQTILL